MFLSRRTCTQVSLDAEGQNQELTAMNSVRHTSSTKELCEDPSGPEQIWCSVTHLQEADDDGSQCLKSCDAAQRPQRAHGTQRTDASCVAAARWYEGLHMRCCVSAVLCHQQLWLRIKMEA